MGGIKDGFGIPKWLEVHVGGVDEISAWLRSFEHHMKVVAQIIEALLGDKGKDWQAIVARAIELVDEAETFIDKTGPQKREYVFAFLSEEYPVAARLINNLIEAAVGTLTDNKSELSN